MTHWLQAIYLMCSSRKGIRTRQLQRMLGGSMRTAWHMGHRIRLAMAASDDSGQIGGPGKTVEAEETYLAKSPKTRKPEGLGPNAKPAPQVFSLVERGGNIRSMYLDDKNIRGALAEHLDERSRLVTDGSQSYRFVMPDPSQHESVDHSKYEWARGDVHTNTLEGFFSIFKRGLVGLDGKVFASGWEASKDLHSVREAAAAERSSTGRSAAMRAKPKKKRADPEAQLKRFQDMGRELGADSRRTR